MPAALKSIRIFSESGATYLVEPLAEATGGAPMIHSVLVVSRYGDFAPPECKAAQAYVGRSLQDWLDERSERDLNLEAQHRDRPADWMRAAG